MEYFSQVGGGGVCGNVEEVEEVVQEVEFMWRGKNFG